MSPGVKTGQRFFRASSRIHDIPQSFKKPFCQNQGVVIVIHQEYGSQVMWWRVLHNIKYSEP